MVTPGGRLDFPSPQKRGMLIILGKSTSLRLDVQLLGHNRCLEASVAQPWYLCMVLPAQSEYCGDIAQQCNGSLQGGFKGVWHGDCSALEC